MTIIKYVSYQNELLQIINKNNLPKNYKKWIKNGIKITKKVLKINKKFAVHFVKSSTATHLAEYVIGSYKKPVILLYLDNILKESKNEEISIKELFLRIGIHETFHYFLERKYNNLFEHDEEEDWVLNMEQKTWEKYFSK